MYLLDHGIPTSCSLTSPHHITNKDDESNFTMQAHQTETKNTNVQISPSSGETTQEEPATGRKRKEKCIGKKKRNLQEQRIHRAAVFKVQTLILLGRRDVMQKSAKRPQRKSTRHTNKGTE
ncbi:uncharacterized protein LOC143815868 isoform X1 [Ranitomeya variabilis]|uniref:uncharacterized protein LOC143815868 isoform X1 n=1 Tax=Ranitomeya variabilis TaxID=490064 RepID=UPI004055AA10